MKELLLAVLAKADLDPESDVAREAVDDAAARVAKTWTHPTFVDSTDTTEHGYEPSDEVRVLRYRCMAEPK